jgi:hypothetical protein
MDLCPQASGVYFLIDVSINGWMLASFVLNKPWPAVCHTSRPGRIGSAAEDLSIGLIENLEGK